MSEMNAEERLIIAQEENRALKKEIRRLKKEIEELSESDSESKTASKVAFEEKTPVPEISIEELVEQKKALEKERNELLSQNKELKKARDNKLRLSYIITALVALLIGAGIAFLTAPTLHKWWQWEHVIGALGGLLLFGLICLLLLLKQKNHFYSIGWLVFGVILLLNVFLTPPLKTDYHIISHWINGYLIAVTATAAYFAFDDGDLRSCVILAVEGVLSFLLILFTAIAMPRFAWWQWENVIGPLGGILLFGIAIIILYDAFHEEDTLFRISHYLLLGVLLILNVVLTATLRQSYFVISYWMNGFLIVVSAYMVYASFRAEEPVAGGILVGEGVLSLLSIILTALLKTKLSNVLWWQWEHVIGALGGLLLFGVAGFLLMFSSKDNAYKFDHVYKFGWVALGALWLINFILTPILQESYFIISYWMSGFLIAATSFAAVRALNDYEKKIGATLIVEGVLSSLSILFAAAIAARFAWWQWQHVIGALGGLVVFGGAVFLLAYTGKDHYHKFEHLYKYGCFAFGALWLLNIILTPILKDRFYVISYWMSGYLIAVSAYAAFRAFDDKKDAFGASLIVEGVLSFLSLLFAAALSAKFAWWQWQHVIGALGGLAIIGAVVFLLLFFDEDNLYVFGWIVFGVLWLVNVILSGTLEHSYYIISYWINGYLFSVSGFAAYRAFDEDETEFGATYIIELFVLFLTVLITAAVANRFVWWQWQHVIGALGGAVIFGVTFFVLSYFNEDNLYMFGWVVLGHILAINIVLTFIYKTRYETISYWINGYLTVASAITAIRSFDESEDGGGFLVAEALISILSIILTNQLL